MNRVFSYSKDKRINRNYSRKDFGNSRNEFVLFDGCTFEQTNFNYAIFDQCIFNNCNFSKLELKQTTFIKVKFIECSFRLVLFNKCNLGTVEFQECMFLNSTAYPNDGRIREVDNQAIQLKEDMDIFIALINKANVNKYIRESNTILVKVKKRRSKETRSNLKKLNMEDAERLGISKKERLSENARRKKNRNEKQQESYIDSLKGTNRIMDKGILEFVKLYYSPEEFEVGLDYAISKIETPFSCFSILMKYIDLGIQKHNQSNSSGFIIEHKVSQRS